MGKGVTYPTAQVLRFWVGRLLNALWMVSAPCSLGPRRPPVWFFFPGPFCLVGPASQPTLRFNKTGDTLATYPRGIACCDHVASCLNILVRGCPLAVAFGVGLCFVRVGRDIDALIDQGNRRHVDAAICRLDMVDEVLNKSCG